MSCRSRVNFTAPRSTPGSHPATRALPRPGPGRAGPQATGARFSSPGVRAALDSMARAFPASSHQAVLNLPSGDGVLASQHLLGLIDKGVVHAGDFTIPAENIQPASLDLRLDEVAYRIQCSFLPDRQTVERKVKDYIIDELDLRKDGVVLETKRPYLIPLKERLALPPGVRGKANPKSSTGRIDVFTRVIT